MKEGLKEQLKFEVVDTLRDKGIEYQPYEELINVYVSMQLHEIVLMEQLEDYPVDKDRSILKDTLNILREDICKYSKMLMLD